MPRKNLTKELIINEAITIICENGYSNFSLHSLARKLDIKAPSIYNHFKSLDDITMEVIKKVLVDYNNFKVQFIGDKQRDEALFAYADAVYTYANLYPELYNIIMLFPLLKYKTSVNRPFIIEALMKILKQYNIAESHLYHLQRVFRSMILGLITAEKAGFFHDETISKIESYHYAIRTFIEMLKAEERNSK